MYQRVLKQFFDVSIAIFLLVMLSPILIAIAAAIKLMMGSPILFTQLRPGLKGQPFVFYKFRSMLNRIDHQGKQLPDDQRLTPLGRFLRKSSLDELPQLFNVLKGEMSFVGPRPLLLEYLPRYTPEQARRHAVKPGITGWAQVNGRQEIYFSQRLELDLYYVDHWSLWLDLKILLLTVLNVSRMTGVKLGQDVREVDDIGLSDDIS